MTRDETGCLGSNAMSKCTPDDNDVCNSDGESSSSSSNNNNNNENDNKKETTPLPLQAEDVTKRDSTLAMSISPAPWAHSRLKQSHSLSSSSSTSIRPVLNLTKASQTLTTTSNSTPTIAQQQAQQQKQTQQTQPNHQQQQQQQSLPQSLPQSSPVQPLSRNPTPPIISAQSSTQSIQKHRSSLRHQLYVAWVLVFFAGSSLGAIFINKTCLTGYHFRYPLTLVLGQMLFAILLLTALHLFGYRPVPIARKEELLSLAIPTALFTSNVVVGLSALSLVNIPMFSAFRRLTLLFVMGAEYVFLKKTHSRAIMYTVIVMTIGAFISAVDDVTFSRLGYCLVFLNNVLTAGYLAAIKRAMKETNFDPLTLLYYTALLGFPLVALLLISTGELAHVIIAFRTQPELLSWRFLASLILTATGAFAVNFSTSLCTHVTSPLTTSVAGQVKNVLQTVLGFFSWGFVPTFLNTVGLLIALGAQIFFAYFKYHERMNENEVKSKPSPLSSSTEVGTDKERERLTS